MVEERKNHENFQGHGAASIFRSFDHGKSDVNLPFGKGG